MKADGGSGEAVGDDWDEDGMRITTAALRHRHVAQAEFVLEGLKPATCVE